MWLPELAIVGGIFIAWHLPKLERQSLARTFPCSKGGENGWEER